MSVNDNHSFSRDGIEWIRLWQNPNMQVDTKVDVNDPKSFVKYTGNRAGKIQELWDTSKEWSEKRKAKEGRDVIEEQYFRDYAKVRKGKQHPKVRRKNLEKALENTHFELE
jgi:Ni/Co efflux regulator RcnB